MPSNGKPAQSTQNTLAGFRVLVSQLPDGRAHLEVSRWLPEGQEWMEAGHLDVDPIQIFPPTRTDVGSCLTRYLAPAVREVLDVAVPPF